MKTKEQYIAPALTVVEFKTERGFAESSEMAKAFNLFSLSKSGYNDNGQQEWDESEGNLFDW